MIPSVSLSARNSFGLNLANPTVKRYIRVAVNKTKSVSDFVPTSPAPSTDAITSAGTVT